MNCRNCGRNIPDYSAFCPLCGTPQKVSSDYDNIKDKIGANVDKIKNDGGAGNRRNSDYMSEKERQRAVYLENRKNNMKNQRSNYQYEDWGLEKKKSSKGAVISTVVIFIIVVLAVAAIIVFGLRPQDRSSSSSNKAVTVETKAADSETTATKEAAATDKRSDETTAKSKETTTKEETTETTQNENYSADDAIVIVSNGLVNAGIIYEDGTNTEGGMTEFIYTETASVGGADIHIIEADFYDADGNYLYSSYYGIENMEGTFLYVELNDDGTYAISA